MKDETPTYPQTVSLLNRINSPADLRKMPAQDLPQLAEEIRDIIINTVSRTGGHLSPNLGVVELTIALHYIFDTPQDKILWDVGHQCYAHKLLTGRCELFSTLRQYQGMSGFPRRAECEFDLFDVGHSGTSISTALGIAEGQKQSGKEHHVIAVIGDGSINTGLAFEGLNNAGDLKSNLIVVLNDNEMSISPNVGALSSYLSRIITGKAYNRLLSEVLDFLNTIPSIGPTLRRVLKQAEGSFKSVIAPGLLFEELGFKYVGPLQGHNLNHLLENLRNIKNLPRRPILLHVITKKGKGFLPAEEDPETFHGIGAFDALTGETPKKAHVARSYTEIFGDTLVALAHKDGRIVAITAGMTSGTGLAAFRDTFPERFYDVGIAEPHAVTFAAGLASQGIRPVVTIYSTFLQRSYDQIFHDVCLQNLPVVFALDRGGLVGEDGSTHHGVFDLSYLRHFPNMVVMAPHDENEFRHMLYTAFSMSCPVAIRYPRGSGEGVALDQTEELIPVGKGEVLCHGTDAVLLAIGKTVCPAVGAAAELKEKGYDVGVINSRFVKPLDEDLICSTALRCRRIVTVEENVLAGGFGSAVLECLERRGVTGVKVKRIGLPDTFIEHGAQEILREKYGLDRSGIVETTQAFLASQSSRKGLPRFVTIK